ncbi:MAG: hypothetical protein JST28_05680 [Acidobacteria bacterium]|nr:hypothetical protein [Acidobacteriota bacterium]
MATLDSWLNQAVRHLSKESADTVRCEIQEHYEAARLDALNSGIEPQQADSVAVQALGDPCVANRQYRKVLLTSSEAKVLRQSNAESRMICSNKWLKWTLLSAPGTLLLLSVIFLAMHQIVLARALILFGVLMATFFVPPFFPIYSTVRGRVYRVIKWTVLIGGVLMLFGKDGWNWAWLNSCCLYPVFYMEWKRMLIRRKLPVKQWPRQLYL